MFYWQRGFGICLKHLVIQQSHFFEQINFGKNEWKRRNIWKWIFFPLMYFQWSQWSNSECRPTRTEWCCPTSEWSLSSCKVYIFLSFFPILERFKINFSSFYYLIFYNFILFSPRASFNVISTFKYKKSTSQTLHLIIN